jgi:hypothetical protein
VAESATVHCALSVIREHEFGTTYEIRAILKGPSGQRVALVSVWVTAPARISPVS